MARADAGGDATAELIAELTRRGLRIAVAESLTGGLVVGELTRIPGASLVVSGGFAARVTCRLSSERPVTSRSRQSAGMSSTSRETLAMRWAVASPPTARTALSRSSE